jgi:hypothetical protein
MENIGALFDVFSLYNTRWRKTPKNCAVRIPKRFLISSPATPYNTGIHSTHSINKYTR